MADPEWTFSYEGFDPEQEGLREALCTLGNGYFATRGASAASGANEVHYPGTYLAGGYNRLKTNIAGRTVENEDLVNIPNWLPLTFRFDDGDWFNLFQVDIVHYTQELHLKKGLLQRHILFRDKQGRETSLHTTRFVHMAHKHLAGQVTEIQAENWSGTIDVHSALDGTVINAGVVRYQQLNNKHLESLQQGALNKEGIWLVVQTNQSRLLVAQAARTRFFREGALFTPERHTTTEKGMSSEDFTFEIQEKQPVRIEKIITLFTIRDRGICEPQLEALEHLAEAGDFSDLLPSHLQAWNHLWGRCDIELENNQSFTQMVLRLHIFHLLQTVSLNSIDLDIGVPARGWHGEAYRGHIFWDELFILPYLDLNIPELVRSLLLYRFRRLYRARILARASGLKGALFPWQSGSNGHEETQQLHLNPKSGRWLPDNTHLQRHVNAAIVYNIWQYFETTHDFGFMSYYGAEIILEIARCLASLATYNPDIDRYEILGVMGPDEYHDANPGSEEPGLNNNTYTNVMVVWVLNTALKTLSLFDQKRQQEIRENITLGDEEIQQWRDIASRMKIVFHTDGIPSQFEGYEDLEEFDWDGYRKKYENISRLDRILEAEGDTPNRYKASKQADVLMLFHLFSAEELKETFHSMGYDFDTEIIPSTIEYYLDRTSNGSTLSNVVHSWVLSRSDRPRSWTFFMDALMSDVKDIQGGTTHEGIHLGAMAGTVDLIQRCYSGIEFRDNVIWLNPCIPDEINRLRMKVQYRAQWFDLEMKHSSLIITCTDCPDGPSRIGFNGKVYEIHPGEQIVFQM